MERRVDIQLRRATPEDAVALATVEVTCWRVAYRGLMPATYLDQLSEADKPETWRENLLKHGLSGRKRVWVALNDAGITGFVRVGPPVLRAVRPHESAERFIAMSTRIRPGIDEILGAQRRIDTQQVSFACAELTGLHQRPRLGRGY